jgi:membrane protein
MGAILAFLSALRRAWQEWMDDNSPLVAGGLSFFALFSLVPLAVITLTLVGHFLSSNNARGLFLEEFAMIFSREAAQSAAVVVSRANFNGLKAGLLSAIVLFWAGSRVFAQLQRALSDMWHIPAPDLTRFEKFARFLLDHLRALAATLGLGIATIIFLTVDVGLGTFGDLLGGYLPAVWINHIVPWITFGASLVAFTLIFAMLYRWLPNAHPGWPAVWGGAMVASVLFAVARLLLSMYLRAFNVLTVFGAAGSVMVLLIWVYASMQILLFGARFAWIIGRKHVQPD